MKLRFPCSKCVAALAPRGCLVGVFLRTIAERCGLDQALRWSLPGNDNRVAYGELGLELVPGATP
jgi:hypothetical protein